MIPLLVNSRNGISKSIYWERQTNAVIILVLIDGIIIS